MASVNAFAMRHPIVYAIVVTFAFVILLVVADIPAGGKPPGFAAGYGIARSIVLGALAIAFASAAGWRTSSGIATSGTSYSWGIIVVPLLYLVAVFPYLFTGSWAPNMRDPRLTALVAANGFATGATEELVFRGLIFLVIVRAWGGGRTAAVKAALVNGVAFSLPHLLNLLDGHQFVRVLAQLGWALILGIAISWLAYAGRSIWPAVVLHGTLNAVVHANRLGVNIDITNVKAFLMVAASLPVLAYAWFVLTRAELTTAPSLDASPC